MNYSSLLPKQLLMLLATSCFHKSYSMSIKELCTTPTSVPYTRTTTTQATTNTTTSDYFATQLAVRVKIPAPLPSATNLDKKSETGIIPTIASSDYVLLNLLRIPEKALKKIVLMSNSKDILTLRMLNKSSKNVVDSNIPLFMPHLTAHQVYIRLLNHIKPLKPGTQLPLPIELPPFVCSVINDVMAVGNCTNYQYGQFFELLTHINPSQATNPFYNRITKLLENLEPKTKSDDTLWGMLSTLKDVRKQAQGVRVDSPYQIVYPPQSTQPVNLRYKKLNQSYYRLKDLLNDPYFIVHFKNEMKDNHFIPDYCPEGGDYPKKPLLLELLASNRNQNEKIQIMTSLLQARASVTIYDHENSTPILKAAEKGEPFCLNFLLEHGAISSINSTCIDGTTPLLAACKKGNVDCISILLKYGAASRITKSDCRGLTPLIAAAMNPKPDCVMVLFNHGAESTIRRWTRWGGKTALHAAARAGNSETVKLLLDNGAQIDINARNRDNWTPLTIAAYEGHIDVVKLLLEKGADTKVTNNKGLTALEVAKKETIKKMILNKRNNNTPTTLTPRTTYEKRPISDLPSNQNNSAKDDKNQKRQRLN